MFSTHTTLHFLNVPSNVKLPEKFDYPFQYTPYEISKIASKEVQNYLENQSDFIGNFNELGKMFGVLIVKTSEDKLAYLAAFSGKIDEKVFIDGFVPPVFDSINPKGFFKIGEQQLNQINKQIENFERDETYNLLKKRINDANIQQIKEINSLRIANKKAKQLREIKRKEAEKNLSETNFIQLSEVLRKESIRQSFILKDLKKNWKIKLNTLQEELTSFEKPLTNLKNNRKTLSATLQQKLHKSYRFFNAKGGKKDLLSIFSELNSQPPAGTGECCAPKLLQFAYKNNLQPISMAEFWWGKSPPSEVKTHKHYYPACKSKCKPVLGFMLQGLNVNENPVKSRKNIELKIRYEDEFLLVLVKPYRFLSVPGKEIKDSVYTRMKNYIPNARGPLLVHRLDMGTSGLLLVAKKPEIHKNLQQQFTDRTVKKRYVAILDGIIKQNNGTINLPLRVDYNNRPRQLVCFKNGRPSITHYEVIERKDNKTKVYLYPVTGRTHQLRVHCAHHLGLNTRIFGDDLYGTTKDRLYLHAEKLEFMHPITKKTMVINCESEF